MLQADLPLENVEYVFSSICCMHVKHINAAAFWLICSEDKCTVNSWACEQKHDVEMFSFFGSFLCVCVCQR